MSTTKPDSDTGWTNKFTSAIGYYFVRERGEDAADASIIEYQGDQRAYISGADDNFWKEWTSGRSEFLGPFTASDFEQLIRLQTGVSFALANAHQWVLSDWQNWLANHLIPLTREALAHTGGES